MLRNFLFYFFSSVFVLSSCFSSDDVKCDRYGSISEIVGNNAYLKHDAIKINEHGIFIYADDRWVPINNRPLA